MFSRRFLTSSSTKLFFLPYHHHLHHQRIISSTRSYSSEDVDFRDVMDNNNDIDFLGNSASFDDNFATSTGASGPNPADFASSGIHGPAATVARRDSNPDTQGKYRQEFHSEKLGRCVLCDEPIGSWAGHVVFVSHQARMAIVERVMNGSCGPHRHVVERWWQLLNVEPEGLMLNRIRSLSSDTNSEKRKERLMYLLRFLQANGILKVALGVYDDESKSFGRSNVFERFEMVGDNVVKVVFYDRLQSLFPISDGGAAGKMAQIQQLIDSNEGLLQAFDYLELDKIIGTSLSQSKFKSDVMEALFGELQTYLWAVTHNWNTPVEYNAINTAAGPELKYIEGVVRHTLLELTDCILLFAVESSVTRAAGVIQREYKGSPHPKPVPLTRSEIENRRNLARLQKLTNENNNNNNNNGENGSKNNKKDDLMSMMMEGSGIGGRYFMKPFLTSENFPIPPELLSGDGVDSNGMNSSHSPSSTFHVGISVIKPLAQRIAEEEEKRRLKELSWRLPAPYFLRGAKEPSVDAEMAHDDFMARMVDAAPIVDVENKILTNNNSNNSRKEVLLSKKSEDEDGGGEILKEDQQQENQQLLDLESSLTALATWEKIERNKMRKKELVNDLNIFGKTELKIMNHYNHNSNVGALNFFSLQTEKNIVDGEEKKKKKLISEKFVICSYPEEILPPILKEKKEAII